MKTDPKMEHHRLLALANKSPDAAIKAARNLRVDEPVWLQLRAMILSDCGEVAGDRTAVEEAVEIHKKLYEDESSANNCYNLANSLGSLARIDPKDGPDWYHRTSELRRKSRALYGHGSRNIRPENQRLTSMLMTNLGNALDAAHRWIEAFEAYQKALLLFPSNGMASGCAAQILFKHSSAGVLGHQPHVHAVALRLAHHAQTNRATVVEMGGSSAADVFSELSSEPGEIRRVPQCSSAYETFVANHRLALSPIFEGFGHSVDDWDDAHILGLVEPLSKGPHAPPIVAMFNVMKADYLVARRNLFEGASENPSDTGLYFDTLDYAIYGRKSALLRLSQRSALDLLDKIAVAINEHLGVGVPPTKVNFESFWSTKESHWRPVLAELIENGNSALIALSEIASDLGAPKGSYSGLLRPEKVVRNTTTHRFLVLHDFGIGEHRKSPSVEHQELCNFEGIALNSVKLARAALLHFIEAVEYHERARQHERGAVFELTLPVLMAT